MKLSRFAIPFVAAVLFSGGCASHRYYAGGPPSPPYNGVSPLIERAQRAGFHAGADDGARDAYNRKGYHPKRDRKFRDAPGYDPALGPFGPYRDAFRNAYLRGYDSGFYRR
ncbi:MAG: hypothetical protein ABI072_08430 [Edaphobacter sp.]